MSKHDGSFLEHIKCVKKTETHGSKRNPNNDKFATAVKKCDRDKVKYFLKNGFCLTDLIPSDGKNPQKSETVIDYIMKRWPRPVQYLKGLFDDYIAKDDDVDIDDHDCVISVDYSILLQSEGLNRSDMKILKSLLNHTKKYETDLLNHPLILGFLHLKWLTELKVFYTAFVLLYLIFVVILTWIGLTIHSPILRSYVPGACGVLYFLMTCMIVQEVFFIAITIWTGHFISSVKKPIWLLNWTSKALWVVVANTDFYIPDRTWPNFILAMALLFAWLEITVLLSYFPECGYMFHMFSIVVNRTVKVFFFFGFQIMMGFSLASFTMVHNNQDEQESLQNFTQVFTKVVVMTFDLDYFEYKAHMQSLTNEYAHELILRVVIFLYISLVSILMMNFLLALIISDAEDLKKSGEVRRTCNIIELIDVLDNVIDIVTSTGILIRKKIQVVWEIHPGRPIRIDDVFPANLQEKMIDKFIKNS